MKKYLTLIIFIMIIINLNANDVIPSDHLNTYYFVAEINYINTRSDGSYLIIIKPHNLSSKDSGEHNIQILPQTRELGYFIVEADNKCKKEIFATILLAITNERRVMLRLSDTITGNINIIDYVSFGAY